MASGDTRTEAMLNVLGNGGSGDEFRGCCNTKTQQYILDAIDRINSIQPGGGINVIDNLESYSTTDALSANMGRVLSEVLQWAFEFKSLPNDDEYPMNWPEDNPDGYRIDMFPSEMVFYSASSEPIKVYYSDTEYIDNFVGYIQVDPAAESENDLTYGFKFTKMNGANNTPEIYVGQSKLDYGTGEMTNLSFTQVGAGGGGSIKDLTSADLDFPVDNPSGVALWNLGPGIYRNATNDNMYLNYSSTQWLQRKMLRAGDIFTVLSKRDYNSNLYSIAQVGMDSYNDIEFVFGNGAGLGSISDLVSFKKVANDLTTASSGLYVLDAAQGKVLNDKITPTTNASAPTTSTQGELGKIFIDTTNDDAYMCVKASGGTYTWKKITP